MPQCVAVSLLALTHSEPLGPVYLLDIGYTRSLRPQDAYEHVHLVAALQGLTNRDQPQYATLCIAMHTVTWFMFAWFADSMLCTCRPIQHGCNTCAETG